MVVARARDVTQRLSQGVFSQQCIKTGIYKRRLFLLNGPPLFRDVESSLTCRKSVRLRMIRGASGSKRLRKISGARP